ncbi:MAG: TonB-dependent receptor [Bacteroidota bacterium]
MRTRLHFAIVFIFLTLLSISATAQHKISGTVIDNKSKPVRGASVYLENTIDGGTTDSMGIFRFTTSESGAQTLVASSVSHEAAGTPLTITADVDGIVITLKANKAHDLDVVTITAGSFDASSDKSKTVLKPLDIVTTAGAGADVVKAMQTLPGTQQTGPDNGLFIRGGDASEAAMIVDEMIVQNAFLSGPPGVATRSRFGAFQYQGMSFSSGGYSARYGQALSGVLDLNSLDLADKSTVNLGANMAGVYASGTKKWKHSSLDGGGNYTNLAPFYGLASTNFKFYKVPVGGGGNVRYVWEPNKDGILKVSASGSYFASGISIPNPTAADTTANNPFNPKGDTVNFVTKNAYYYTNISYRQMFKHKYSLYTAASFSLDKTNNSFGTIPIDQQEHREQFRIEGKDFINARLSVLLGTDIQRFGIDRKIALTSGDINNDFTETIVSGYTEVSWTPIYWLAIRPGLRYEHSTLLDTSNIAPRLSMAVRTGSHSQASLATGMFYQEAPYAYLLAGLRPQMQQAIHYIANWQWTSDGRTLRLEGYYKDYKNLLRETSRRAFNPNAYRTITPFDTVDNGGYGYAKGLELFWRDKKTVSNLDYWISYSFIDTKRKYLNYPSEATPGFISDHNLSLVGKYFINKIQTNISATYSYASGRPYYNPITASNDSKFMTDKAPEYHNLAISAAWLHTFGKWFTVFYISIDNVTNYKNIFGYRYLPKGGTFTQTPVVPAMYRTIFFGVNMSLTQFSKDEL